MQLTGIHHLTAVTARIRENRDFYTGILGLRLVKRTVNQDDVSAYHLFYADGTGSPGTDITFFDWPAKPESRGTRSIIRTFFRVEGVEALEYWAERFAAGKVVHDPIREIDGRRTLLFEDPEGQRLGLVEDGGQGDDPSPWSGSGIPEAFQIRGLGPIHLSVPDPIPTDAILRSVLDFRVARHYDAPPGSGTEGAEVTVYEMADGGAHAEVHLHVEPHLRNHVPGAGGVHHVAFRVPDQDAYERWAMRLNELRVPNSGMVDRYYFRSLYFREPNGILFELATDDPGFAVDEPMETLGENLVLPPFLEGRRAEIVEGLRPID